MRSADSSGEKSLIMCFCLLIFRPVDPDGFTKHGRTHVDFQTRNQFNRLSQPLTHSVATKLVREIISAQIFFLVPVSRYVARYDWIALKS